MTITRQRLIELLDYDPETGVFVWRVKRYCAPCGSVAGSLGGVGYWKLRIDGVGYAAHRLAFLYMTGEMPVNDVDHIDGDKLNNAWANLRDVTHQVNQQNRVRPNRRKTGRSSQYLGVSWKKDKSKWAANIQGDNGKAKFIGYYETELEAHEAYLAVKRQTHEGNTL